MCTCRVTTITIARYYTWIDDEKPLFEENCQLYIAHPHILVWATNERFLLAGVTFRVGSASESHWLQPMLVRTVRWWPAPVCVGELLVADEPVEFEK